MALSWIKAGIRSARGRRRPRGAGAVRHSPRHHDPLRKQRGSRRLRHVGAGTHRAQRPGQVRTGIPGHGRHLRSRYSLSAPSMRCTDGSTTNPGPARLDLANAPRRRPGRPRRWQHPWQLPDRPMRSHRPPTGTLWTIWRDSDGYGTRDTRLRAWSGITGWRFESSSAHDAKAPRGGAVVVRGAVTPRPGPSFMATASDKWRTAGLGALGIRRQGSLEAATMVPIGAGKPAASSAATPLLRGDAMRGL